MQGYRVEDGDLVRLSRLVKRRRFGQCSMQEKRLFEIASIARCASLTFAVDHPDLQLRYWYFRNSGQKKSQMLGGRNSTLSVERRKMLQRVLNPAIGWNWSSHYRSYHQCGNGHQASPETGSQKRLQRKRWKMQWVSLIVFNHIIKVSPYYMVSSSSFLDMTLARRCSWLISRGYTALPSATASSREDKGFRMNSLSLMGASVTRCPVAALSSCCQPIIVMLHRQVTDEIDQSPKEV